MLQAFEQIEFNPITTVTNSDPRAVPQPMTFWLELTGTGAVSATVDIRVSTDGTVAKERSILTAPISLSGTNAVADYSETCRVSGIYRVYVTAISGTGATLNASARS